MPLKFADPGQRWTLSQPLLKFGQGGGITAGNAFHLTIVPVPHPAAQAQLAALGGRGLSKADSLYAAADREQGRSMIHTVAPVGQFRSGQPSGAKRAAASAHQARTRVFTRNR